MTSLQEGKDAWAARKRKRKKVAGTPEVPASAVSVPFTDVAPVCFDVVRMDTYENKVPDKYRFLHSHSEVWRDLLSWEEIRYWLPCQRAKRVSQEPFLTPVLFGPQDSVASAIQVSEPGVCSEPSLVSASPPPDGGGFAYVPPLRRRSRPVSTCQGSRSSSFWSLLTGQPTTSRRWPTPSFAGVSQ